MRVVILGSAGIIGQSLRLCTPEGVEPVWVRRKADYAHMGLDITNRGTTGGPDPRDLFLKAMAPQVIINLAGENRPDVVERTPWRYTAINVEAPAWLAWWCEQNGCHYVHVSSQAVFGGEPPKEMRTEPLALPPYAADSIRIPVNAYGHQKLQAEQEVKAACKCWSIVRPTFVLGVRPFPLIGRENPVERWLAASAPVAEGQTDAKLLEVSNRYFSPSFAWQVAGEIWGIAQGKPLLSAVNLGVPVRTTRYQLAQQLRTDIEIEPVDHTEAFPGLAPRPLDTAYAGESTVNVYSSLQVCAAQFEERGKIGLVQRAKEFAVFMGMDEGAASRRLLRGFGPLHNEVADDFRKANPQTDDELLKWYRTTEAYIWELSAYHIDPGFNYAGMCEGIINTLRSNGVKEALVLGDGIGDMAIALGRAGIHGVYHDLKNSLTAAFAEFRQMMYLGTCDMACTDGWEPLLPVVSGSMQAIISCDFMEHLPSPDSWLRAVYDRLEPGGLFMGQHAFGIGSGPDGSIPMHLSCNDHYEKDYGPLMIEIGFVQEGTSNWWRKSS